MPKPEGIPNGRAIMRERLLKARKEELEKNLKKDKRYVVSYSGKFEGKFSHIEERPEGFFAVFTDDGHTDKGSTPTRKINISHLLSAELKKT